ncbi:sigma-70 family RNA polymerase sigma factor [Actinophytocola glycyrrhizae]|uniref:Sigma-70 family RNA polymerase sigma factor n=1 Tax=Actinophytocola glycyrrhizae TaxID=2044873 RepID=A0ABV9S8Y7_9PSEU
MQEQLAARFEADRDHLRAVAYRMLGSASEAEDALQEAWLRFARSDTGEVENLTGWLTTVVARVCLTMLRARSRREEPVESLPEPAAAGGPEDETVLADSVGLALLVVLDTLAPAERLAFVLHDLFAVPFDEIAPVVGRTPAATRQLASRARRRVRGADTPGGPVARRREVVRAFLAASRGGDFTGLVALLDPDATLRSDDVAVRMGGNREVVGADAVARDFSGRARDARPALLDGLPGAVWAPRGKVRVAVRFTFDGDTVTGLELLADPDTVARLDIGIED